MVVSITHQFNGDAAAADLVDAAQLDTQLGNLAAAQNAETAERQRVISDGGRLANQIVRYPNLHPEITALLTAGGMIPLQSAAVVSLTNQAALSGLLTIDGYTLLANDRVLLVGQTNPLQNGLWVAAAGAWTRPSDSVSGQALALYSQVNVLNGTTQSGSTWILKPAATVDSTAQVWLLFSGFGTVIPLTRGGTGATSAAAALTNLGFSAFIQTLINDVDADTARTTLGLPSQAMAARTVVANDTAGVANGAARNIDDLTVLADGSTTRRDLSARFAQEFHVNDYGATGDGVTDDTAAVQAALDACYNAGGGTLRFGRGTYSLTTIVKQWVNPYSIRFIGVGTKATLLAKRGAGIAPVLDISSNLSIVELYCEFSDFAVAGNSKACDGLRFTNCAYIPLRNLYIYGCNVGLDIVGSLVFKAEDVVSLSNNYGIRTRKNAGYFCNLITIIAGSFRGNTSWGMDIGDASGMRVIGTDIESNGTAADTGTGGVIIRSTCDDEIGYARFYISAWLEANLGNGMVVEPCAGLSLSIDDTNYTASEAGRALTVGAIQSIMMRNCESGSTNDTWTIAATNSLIIGGIVYALADTSTYRTHIGLTIGLTGPTSHLTNTQTVGSRLLMNPTAVIATPGGYVDNGRILRITDKDEIGNYAQFNHTNGAPGNAAACTLFLASSGTTGRSVNAGGTLNAAGADYAEYEQKSADCAPFAKGDLVGFNAAGLLTDRFDDAVSFGIKSTAPCIVGGDTWFSEQAPKEPAEGEKRPQVIAAYQAELVAFNERLEIARGKVDRIAYSGKVPANVADAAPGLYVVAARSPTGGIAGKALVRSAITEEDRDRIVGRVRSMLEDGRPMVVVCAPGGA